MQPCGCIQDGVGQLILDVGDALGCARRVAGLL